MCFNIILYIYYLYNLLNYIIIYYDITKVLNGLILPRNIIMNSILKFNILFIIICNN